VAWFRNTGVEVRGLYTTIGNCSFKWFIALLQYFTPFLKVFFLLPGSSRRFISWLKNIFRQIAFHGLRVADEELLLVHPGQEGLGPLDEVCLLQFVIRMAFLYEALDKPVDRLSTFFFF
jgi:hypothetical protein